MKTLAEINTRIAELTPSWGETGKYYAKNNPKQSKVIAKELELLRNCKMYLESEPSEEFVKAEIDRIKAIVTSKNAQYEQWLANHLNTPIENPKAKYRTLTNLDALELQLFTLTFIYFN